MRGQTTRNIKHVGPPNPTWRDIKQLGYALLMVVPMIVVVCFGAAVLVGRRAAFWIGVGLVTLTGITFAVLVVVSFWVTHIDNARQSKLHRQRR